MNNSIKLHEKEREIERLKKTIAEIESLSALRQDLIEIQRDCIKNLEAELAAQQVPKSNMLHQSYTHLKVHHS